MQKSQHDIRAKNLLLFGIFFTNETLVLLFFYCVHKIESQNLSRISSRVGLKYVSGKGQTISKAGYGFLNSSKKRTKLTILSIFFTQDSEFLSFFGRIEVAINCFRHLLTFTMTKK